MKHMSEKIYLQLNAPTEEDFRSSAQRITDALESDYGRVYVPERGGLAPLGLHSH